MNDGPNLILDHRSIFLEEIVENFHQGIEVGDNNNPVL